jgi:hypothetical protein
MACKALFICVLGLLFGGISPAQETKSYPTIADMQRDITQVLLDRNLTTLTNELAREQTVSTAPLLWRLAVFARAGQRTRVRQTLAQLAAAPDWNCPGSDAKYFVRSAGGEDLLDLRFYYERLCPADADGAEGFVRVWEKQGELKELDSWLAARSSTSDEWLMQRIYFRKRQGSVNEVIDELAQELRANPGDSNRLDRYLRATAYGEKQDVGWVADVFKMRLAFDYFDLGSRLSERAPGAAVRLLEKSLALPFTDDDARLVENFYQRGRSIVPARKINWEKQLRYWSKHALAESYKALNQPLAAQPLVEELTSMKGDDIEMSGVHELAGAVQSGSGQRVVETKLLREEATRRDTAEYWIERADYYNGRDEDQLQLQTYREGLLAVPNHPRDAKAANQRLELVRRFAFFLGDSDDDDARQAELVKLLKREFTSAPPETDYAFRIAELLTQDELEVEALRISLLTSKPALFARLLAARKEWEQSEQSLIESVTTADEVTTEQKKKIWAELERLIDNPGSTRAYTMAQVMIASEEWPRAIALLDGYVRNALPSNWDGYKPAAMRDLLNAYAKAGDWKAAERFLYQQRDLFSDSYAALLATIAVAAGKRGATDDAIRLWRLSANLDRRDLSNLNQLAQTSAKPELQKLYLQMKKEDPESFIPEVALRLLQ